MKAGLNIKIGIHWLIVLLSIVFLQFIDINQKAYIILIAFLLSTLVFNQATYLSVRKERLVLIKRILFFIPVFWKSYELSEIKKISFVETLPEDFKVNFEGTIVSKIITGSYFYDSKWKINIELFCNEILESDLSLLDRDVKRLEKKLAG